MPRLSAAAAACVSWAALLCALAHADGAESRPPRAAPLLHLPPGAAPRRGAAEPPALPPIEEWWPHLPVEARHEILDAPASPLPDTVLDEIRAITDHEVPDPAVLGPVRLSDEDQGFIATQQEPVD